jgi:hypothetical protein
MPCLLWPCSKPSRESVWLDISLVFWTDRGNERLVRSAKLGRFSLEHDHPDLQCDSLEGSWVVGRYLVVIELGDCFSDGGFVQELLLIDQASHQGGGAHLVDSAR